MRSAWRGSGSVTLEQRGTAVHRVHGSQNEFGRLCVCVRVCVCVCECAPARVHASVHACVREWVFAGTQTPSKLSARFFSSASPPHRIPLSSRSILEGYLLKSVGLLDPITPPLPQAAGATAICSRAAAASASGPAAVGSSMRAQCVPLEGDGRNASCEALAMLARNDWEDGSAVRGSRLTLNGPSAVQSSDRVEPGAGMANGTHSKNRGEGRSAASMRGVLDLQEISYQERMQQQQQQQVQVQVQEQRSAVYYQLGGYADALWRSLSGRINSGEWKAARALRVQKVGPHSLSHSQLVLPACPAACLRLQLRPEFAQWQCMHADDPPLYPPSTFLWQYT